MKRIRNSIFIILAFVFSLSFAKNSFAGDFIKNGDYKYYFENGSFVINSWKIIDNTTYYFDELGRMATSLCKIGKNYHLFHVNGAIYKEGEKVKLNGREYEIGLRGKVSFLENDIDDNTYFKILAELKANETEDELFIATSYASPDKVPEHALIVPEEKREENTGMTEQEERLAIASAYNKYFLDQAAADAVAAKYDILNKKYRDELLLTAQFAGIDSNSTIDALLVTLQTQINIIKTNYFNQALTILQTKPETLNLKQMSNEFSLIIKEYVPEVATACNGIKIRYSIPNTSFALIKDRFDKLLENEDKSFYYQLYNLLHNC